MKLLTQVRTAIRLRHYSRRTEKQYIWWIRRFIDFHQRRHPAELGQAEVAAFLGHLAVERRVSGATQNQALSALLFLYGEVLHQRVAWMADLVRAKAPRRLPAVLTPDEARAILDKLNGTASLVCRLLYGSGLRLMEALQLRVQHLEFARGEIRVRGGKGDRDRVTMLPVVLKKPLQQHLERVHALHRQDVAAGAGWVELPAALDRKYPNAGREWAWQWVFPGKGIATDLATGERRRYHLHQTTIQRAFREAARLSGVPKAAHCHTLRHSFATELLRSNYDIRTVQELLGHKDVRVTMTYLHVLNRGGLGVRSPMDTL
ncbi:MAG TPA: integron integrase [Gemmatimonadales bacterium]|nr:integron integrase [Gemmatimonadales bacterium]